MSDTISQIKERLSVVDVISGYLKLQKSGVNFKARCPFHNEKSASFYVSPERQIWHCFGCGVGGDIFGFIKQMEGVEFPDALRILAQRAGVKLASYDPAVSDAKTTIYQICETASRFFEKQLYHSPTGKKALAYLRGRGLLEETIKDFRLGFAPDGWHNLSRFLLDSGYQEKDIIGGGVALKRENGSDIYDRFRSRIIFPIADINDQVVGFTGRVFEDSSNIPEFPGHKLSDPGAKYINTPQTVIYDKSRVLYGFNKAKTESRRSDRCLLVEGNMDAIMSYQAGVKNVAATSGTALTPSHLQLLQRYTNNLDFCFDIDQAGLVATRRGIGLALSHSFNVKIVYLQDKECKDPADYVNKFGSKWQELVGQAKPAIDFYFDKIRSELDMSSVEGKKAMLASLGPLIKHLASRVERSHWVSRLAAVFKTKEEAVEADLLAVKDDLDIYIASEENPKQAEGTPQIKSQNDLLLEALLAVVLKNPSLFKNELDNIGAELIGAREASVLGKIKETNGDSFQFDNFIKTLGDDQKMNLEFANLKAQEFLKDFSDQELLAEFHNLKNKLEQRLVSARLASLELDIKAAESENDKNRLKVLLNEFNNLAQKIHN